MSSGDWFAVVVVLGYLSLCFLALERLIVHHADRIVAAIDRLNRPK